MTEISWGDPGMHFGLEVKWLLQQCNLVAFTLAVLYDGKCLAKYYCSGQVWRGDNKYSEISVCKIDT